MIIDPRRFLNLDPRALLEPVGEWSRDALKTVLDQAASLGRATEKHVLDTARSIEIPVIRVEQLGKLPIETRDDIAERITKGHASLAAVTCGAAGTVPIGGLFLELVALAELNMVQVDHVARAYGFDIGGPKKGVLKELPFGGSRTILLIPILAALEVRALERDGKTETISDLLDGTAKRSELQALSTRLAYAAAVALLKRTATKPLRRFIPLAGGAISAWSSYKFTDAVGREAKTYFRALALGEVIVRGKRIK